MTTKWLDTFLTRSEEDAGSKYGQDDVFCCPVQSVFISKDGEYAFITEEETEWVCPLFTNYSAAEAKLSNYSEVESGDIVRVGATQQGGFTNYMTVLEVKTVKYLANSTNKKVLVKRQEPSVTPLVLQPLPVGGTPTEDTNYVQIQADGIAHKCLRLSTSFNCTTISDRVNTDQNHVDFWRGAIFVPNAANTTGMATLETRDKAIVYTSSSRKAYPAESDASEGLHFPLYLSKPWTAEHPMTLKLGHGVKRIHSIKLVGYTFVNKKNVGVQHGHELIRDDYIILRIKEIEGEVLSNNAHAHHAFAVIQAGHSQNTETGGIEFSMYDPHGIATLDMPSPVQGMTQITVEVLDREGKPAKFGRFHLWFKLCVTHG